MITSSGPGEGPESFADGTDHLTSADFVLIADDLEQRLEAGISNPANAVQVCLAHIDELEDRFGANTGWDSLRLRLTDNLHRRGLGDMALGVVRAIRAPHTRVDALECMTDNRSWHRYLIERTFRDDSEARLACLRALRDRLLRHRYEHPLIQQLEREFSAVTDNYSAVADWADSQAAEHPGADWDDIMAITSDDEAWDHADLDERRYTMIVLIQFDEACAADQLTESHTATVLSMLQFPVSSRRPVYDRLRARCANALMDRGHLESAETFIAHVRDAETRSALRELLQARRDALAAEPDGQTEA